MVAALRAELADLDVAVLVEPRAAFAGPRGEAHEARTRPGDDPLDIVWVDLTDLADVRVFAASHGGLRALVRKVHAGRGAEDAVAEEVAVVARSTVTAMRDPARASAFTPPPPPPPFPSSDGYGGGGRGLAALGDAGG